MKLLIPITPSSSFKTDASLSISGMYKIKTIASYSWCGYPKHEVGWLHGLSVLENIAWYYNSVER